MAVDTLCGKYLLVQKARHEWEGKFEHKMRTSTAEIKNDSLRLSRAQDNERVDGTDSKILRLGKWAWIMQRATEMEQESRGRKMQD